MIHKMFGRTVLCIYNEQPVKKRAPRYRNYTNDTDTDTDTDDTSNDTNINHSDTGHENINQENTQQKNPKENNKNTQNQPPQSQQTLKENTTDQLNKHNNFTLRKPKQNIQNQEYTMEKLPPENNNANYPSLQTSTTDQKNANPTKTTNAKTSTPTPKTPEIAVIPETQIMPETQSLKLLLSHSHSNR